MTSEKDLRRLLEGVACGEHSVDNALASLRALPFEELGFAKLDHHRELRCGWPEVVYCTGKTPAQVAGIFAAMSSRRPGVLGTRASVEHYEATRSLVRDVQYDALSRCLWIDREAATRRRVPGVTVVAAGTSDLPVAEEACRTLDLFGHEPRRVFDVGVAGLHRLLSHLDELQASNVVVVVAGMEGALPSVVSGLVAAPVVAVPTSVGYGASFGGLAALLTMLNGCAGGMSVVNIDNGYGAAHFAASINQRIIDASPTVENAK
jgi:NCAIR mutase (PurE)-related protein